MATITNKSYLDESGLAYFWSKIKTLLSGKQDIVNFSTTEQDTGIKWIDGSAIYQKTINFGTLPNATSKSVAHGIQNLKLIVRQEMWITNGTFFAQLPFLNTASISGAINSNANATNIVVTTGSDRRSWSGYCTLYYTKTT